MLPRDGHAAWDAQRAVLRALVFDASSEPTRSSTITAGRAFLDRTDARQVVRTAARMTLDVLVRRRRGALPLRDCFAGTLAAVPLEAHADLASRFCRSRWFAGYGEVPDRTDQLSAEEAFYRFVCDEQIGTQELRLVEFADAIIGALAVQPRPAFRVPSEVQRAPFGYFMLVEVSNRTLVFAAAHDRVVRGPVDPSVAEVLRHRGHRPPGSAMSAAVWLQVVDGLASTGLSFAS